MALRGPRIFKLSVRLPGTGAVAPRVIGGDGLADSRHILLLVHGFNNSHDVAETSYAAFIKIIFQKFGDKSSAPDAIAKFHWPGDQSTLLGTTIGYPFDITHAREAAQRLAEFLTTLPVANPASLRITIVGHSMGCRLILEALAQINASRLPGIAVVGLMAAASPVDLVKRSARLFKTGNPPRRMLKFFSEQDQVLQFGFPAGQLLAFLNGAEQANYDEAIGRHGNPGEFGSARRTQNIHGAYWADDKVVAIVVEQVDPTTRDQLPAAQLPGRALPTPRDLPSR